MKNYDIENDFTILKLGMDNAIEREGKQNFYFPIFFSIKHLTI